MNGLTPGVLVAVGGILAPSVATAASEDSPLLPDLAAAAAFSSLAQRASITNLYTMSSLTEYLAAEAVSKG